MVKLKLFTVSCFVAVGLGNDCSSNSSTPKSTKDRFALHLRSSHSLDECKNIHASICSSGHGRDRFLGNILIQMYTKQGNLELALSTFKEIEQPNVFSWTILIAAFAGYGHIQRAFQLLWTMQNEGVRPNEVTISSILTFCRDLEQVQRLQKLAKVAGLGDEERILRTLIHSYGECGSVQDAREVFDKMGGAGDLVSCTALMGAYIRNGLGCEALELFDKMNLEGLKYDKISLVAALNACAWTKDFQRGELCHELLIKMGLDTDLILQNTLLSMYGKCGMVDELLVVFSTIAAPDVVSYNSTISGLSHNSRPEEALFFFRCMLRDGTQPSVVTFISIAHACGCVGESGRAAQLRWWISERSASNAVLRSAIVAMHARFGDVEAARKAFEPYPLEQLSCTSMIAAYVQNHEFSRALHLFRRMQLHGIKPNKVAFLSLLDACSKYEGSSQPNIIYNCVVDAGHETDHEIGNALINMFGACGSLEQARKFFEKKSYKDVFTWTGMIGSYAHSKEEAHALKLFKEMHLNGIKPNKVSFVVVLDACANSNAKSSVLAVQGRKIHEQIVETGLERDPAVGNGLINMYASRGCLREAKAQLEKMQGLWNRTSWNTMICGLARSKGHEQHALELISVMELEGISSDSITSVLALEACSNMAAFDPGQHIHAQISESGNETNLVLQTCLINLYQKCGSVSKARHVFERCRIGADTVLWNAMVGTYARHGRVEESVELFRGLVLEGVVPDKVTFLSVLAAICHCYCQQEEEATAVQFFLLMNEFMVKPGTEHFTCMVDFLARRGRLPEAEELLKAMPLPFARESINLVPLLAACKHDRDVKRAKWTAEFMMELDPNQAPAYILLSDVYASAAAF